MQNPATNRFSPHVGRPGGKATAQNPETGFCLTSRGAMLGLFAICLVTCLIAAVRQTDLIAGLGFCTGCSLAPLCVRRAALLQVVLSAPVVFLFAEIVTQGLTAQGDSSHASVLSVLEGTFLTLAAIAPWLFAGSAACVAIAYRRGLRQSVRDLGARLRGENIAVTSPKAPGPNAVSSARNATPRPAGERNPVQRPPATQRSA